jgi:hypothetical protein
MASTRAKIPFLFLLALLVILGCGSEEHGVVPTPPARDVTGLWLGRIHWPASQDSEDIRFDLEQVGDTVSGALSFPPKNDHWPIKRSYWGSDSLELVVPTLTEDDLYFLCIVQGDGMGGECWYCTSGCAGDEPRGAWFASRW